MLSGIENKLAALVADGLAALPHLSVAVGGLPPAPAAGQGAVVVSLAEVVPERSFPPGGTALLGGPGAFASRRVLPLTLTARIALFERPADATAAAAAAARSRLLEDLSTVAHNLADPAVRTGEAFATAAPAVPDQGFRVFGFELTRGDAGREPVDGVLAAELLYAGRAEVWPVGVTAEEGEIQSVATVVAVPEDAG